MPDGLIQFACSYTAWKIFHYFPAFQLSLPFFWGEICGIAYIRSAGTIAGMTLIIKRGGTVLVEKLTHHGSPSLLLSETKDGALRDDAFEEVKAILRQNEDTLKRRCGCEPWMGWPLAVSYGGNSYALDRESFERSENDLKVIIRELVSLLQKAGIAVFSGDFAC